MPNPAPQYRWPGQWRIQHPQTPQTPVQTPGTPGLSSNSPYWREEHRVLHWPLHQKKKATGKKVRSAWLLCILFKKKMKDCLPPKPHHPTPNAQPTPPSQGFCTAPNHPPTAAARSHAVPAPPAASSGAMPSARRRTWVDVSDSGDCQVPSEQMIMFFIVPPSLELIEIPFIGLAPTLLY